MILSMRKLAIVAKQQNRCKVFVKTEEWISFVKYKLLSLRTHACYTHVNTSGSGCRLGFVDIAQTCMQAALSIVFNNCGNTPPGIRVRVSEFSNSGSRAMMPPDSHRVHDSWLLKNFSNVYMFVRSTRQQGLTLSHVRPLRPLSGQRAVCRLVLAQPEMEKRRSPFV